MLNFVFVFEAVLLHRIGNILASVDALFFVSCCKLLRTRGADARQKTLNLRVVGSSLPQQKFNFQDLFLTFSHVI